MQTMASTTFRNTWDQRFLASTRGRVVALLRGTARTVDELARELDLTDNAVRAHLATLERDGLVRQADVRRGAGSGKPANVFGLTPEAETLFPKAYGELLRQLLQVLPTHLGRDQVDAILRDLARRLTDGQQLGAPLAKRVEGAVVFLGAMGGLATSEATDTGYRINGCSCPMAGIVPGNPDACRLAEMLLEELLGAPVEERCSSTESPPRCQFDIAAPLT